MSPVSSISMACLRGTLRDSATIGVEQNNPMCTPGVAKLAVVDATARSQVATSWHPAAVAGAPTPPSTRRGTRQRERNTAPPPPPHPRRSTPPPPPPPPRAGQFLKCYP